MTPLQQLKDDIVATFKPFDVEKIILFGSLARGEDDEYSDIDVIIVYETAKPFLERLKELYLAWNIPRAVDILAYRPDEFVGMMRENVFLQEAVHGGETLYERG